MNTYLQEAFNQVLNDARKPEQCFVCLMESVPYYGGPEEGGWWGKDSILVAFQEFATKELAEQAIQKIEKLASELQTESQKEYGQQCLREMDWLEARGLDSDFLLEPDGPSEFYVLVISEIPENKYGNRQYS